MSGTVRSAARLAAWTAGLLVTGRLLYSLGSDGVQMPITSLTDLRTWLAATPPPTMAIAVLRLAALAGITYLLAATALAVAAGLIRAKPLEAAVQRLTPAVVRRMAAGGSGVGLALGTALGTIPSSDLAPHPIIATGTLASTDAYVRDTAPHDPRIATMTRDDPHVATMTRTADPPTAGPAAASSTPDPTAPTAPTPPAPAAPASPPAVAVDEAPTRATPDATAHQTAIGSAASPTPIEAAPTPLATSSAPIAAATSAPPAAAAEGAPNSAPIGDAPTSAATSTADAAAAEGASATGAVSPAAGDGGSLPIGLARTGRRADTPGPSPPAGPDDGGATGTAGPPPLTATMIRIDGSPAPVVGSGAAPLPQPGNTWVVGPGDSFWSIAEDVLASPGGSPPGEREVGRYWRRLIEANRDRLVAPGNPDLLLPGQELVLPP